MKRKRIITRERKENHVLVCIKANNDDDYETIQKEIRKTLQRLKRLSDEKTSYEIIETRH